VRPRNSGQRKHEEPTSLPVPHMPEHLPGRDIAIGFCLVAVFFILCWSALSNFWHDRTAPELQRGLDALAKNQVTEAQHFFDSVLSERPDEPEIYLRIFQECQKYRHWNLLVQYGERGVLDCRYASMPIRSVFHISLTYGYLGLEKRREALLEAKRAWELNRNEPILMNHYGFILADLANSPEDLNRAEQLILNALQKLRPLATTPEGIWNLVTVEDSYGWVLFRKGRYEEAVTVLTRALDNVPENVEASDSLKEMYYHLGAAYRKVERYAEAKKMLEVALYYDANYKNARAELEALLNTPPLPPYLLPGPWFHPTAVFAPLSLRTTPSKE
jgi:tetratricopeptide (TPR) repeat protein